MADPIKRLCYLCTEPIETDEEMRVDHNGVAFHNYCIGTPGSKYWICNCTADRRHCNGGCQWLG